MPFLSPNCMVHCLFIYIAAGHHIWRSFPYPPPGDAAGSLQQGPNSLQQGFFWKRDNGPTFCWKLHKTSFTHFGGSVADSLYKLRVSLCFTLVHQMASLYERTQRCCGEWRNSSHLVDFYFIRSFTVSCYSDYSVTCFHIYSRWSINKLVFLLWFTKESIIS